MNRQRSCRVIPLNWPHDFLAVGMASAIPMHNFITSATNEAAIGLNGNEAATDSRIKRETLVDIKLHTNTNKALKTGLCAVIAHRPQTTTVVLVVWLSVG